MPNLAIIDTPKQKGAKANHKGDSDEIEHPTERDAHDTFTEVVGICFGEKGVQVVDICPEPERAVAR